MDEEKVDEQTQKEAPKPPLPTWIVSAEPVGDNPALKAGTEGRERSTGPADEGGYDNVGGVVVYVERTNGRRTKEEVARVGFVRASSENPSVAFKTQLDEVIQVARDTADTLNTLQPDGQLL